ncbi:energy-coupling factor transporter ATPase [Bacillota bacterium LX-D]|nr:energy-coupling factor transporter ATPase [Bacillota bacterium LX-D]
MIKIEKLYHRYKAGTPQEVTALDNINLEVKKGEFVVIIGHNGSGKSTLAKHLNGLLLPSEGNVIVNGMNTRESKYVWEIRREVGMVFQNPDNQLVATMVEEDVAFGPENLGVPPSEIRRRVDESLELVGMQEFKHKEPHHLSGGQKQRVAIAGVIAMKPNYLVLDEPTAMLDPKGRKEVMDTVIKLNREEGLSIIHITHYMEEAVNAHRVIVMEQGKIVEGGLPRQIFQQVELLKKLRMDVPQMTELAYELKKAGLELPGDILTVEEMVKYLC